MRSSPNSLSRFARVIASCSSDALYDNYDVIRRMVPHQSIMPMIKANAYGHGAVWVAKSLAQMPALYGFGVATLEEGLEVRETLGSRRHRVKILVMSGTTPWTEDKGQFCERHDLTPVIATERDWQQFLKGGWAERISYELKFNTGMNRLGIPIGLAPAIARSLRNRSTTTHPSGVLSHLAIADHPESKLSISQKERFISLRGELSGAFPNAHFHLASSSGIWKHQAWGLKDLTDVVRPGIALYGIAPWDGAPERGLTPVMSLKASVVAVNQLKRGDSTGYGGAFTFAGTDLTYVATLSAGYADGIQRALSNYGYAWVSGHASRFTGVVSMDLCTIGCTAKTRVGEWAEIIGPKVDIWAQAREARTIPYELLTSISSRVQRVYDK